MVVFYRTFILKVDVLCLCAPDHRAGFKLRWIEESAVAQDAAESMLPVRKKEVPMDAAERKVLRYLK